MIPMNTEVQDMVTQPNVAARGAEGEVQTEQNDGQKDDEQSETTTEYTPEVLSTTNTMTIDQIREAAESKPLTDRTYEDLLIDLGNDFSEEDKEPFKALITEYSDIFALTNKDITGSTLEPIKITLKDPNTKPVRSVNFNHKLEHRKIIQEKIEQMLENGEICHSDSPYSASTFLVPKITKTPIEVKKSWRLVFDYRALNKLTQDQVYFVPTIPEIVQKIASVKPTVYSGFDIRNAFGQIALEEETQRLLAFSTPEMHCQPLFANFGAKQIPAQFQQRMVKLLSKHPLLHKHCIVFIDDINCFTPDLDTMKRVVELLFKTLREVNLKLHVEKCQLLRKSLDFVGHKFGENNWAPCERKISAMLEFKRPTNRKSLKSFLGLISYYRVFIPNFSIYAAVLQNNLSKHARWKWTPEHEEAFEKLRRQLSNVKVLAYPDESENAGPLVVQCDASDYAIAYTISQKTPDGNAEALLGAFGRKLRPNERNYSIGEREALALVTAIIKNKYLLAGKQVVLRTDNITTKFLKNLKVGTSPRLLRWSMLLQDILSNCEFEHVKGEYNVVCDALSRNKYTEEPELTPDELDVLDDESAINILTTVEAEEVDMQDTEELLNIDWISRDWKTGQDNLTKHIEQYSQQNQYIEPQSAFTITQKEQTQTVGIEFLQDINLCVNAVEDT